MDEFMDVLNVVADQDFHLQHRATLNRLYRELNRSKSDLVSLRDRSGIVENTLSKYEYQLQGVEDEVYRELNKELLQNISPNIAQLPSRSSQTPAPSKHEAVQDLDLQDRLYSRMGDLRIHLERLNNFEFDLREQLEERDSLRAAGQVHLSTDFQFFERARDERARIQRELEETQVEVQELKKRCIRDGIDFEEPQFPEELYHSKIHSSTSELGPAEIQPDVQQDSSTIIGDFFTAQERISRWLDNPFGSPKSDEQVARVATGERTRRESSSSDIVWIRTPSPTRHQTIKRCGGRQGSAEHYEPQWRSGPPPGSSLIEALLLESASTPLGRYAHQSQSNATSNGRHSACI